MIFLLKERDVKTITGWETLLHFSKEFDAEMLSDWKDELNNILIFVGFSYTSFLLIFDDDRPSLVYSPL